MKFLRSNRGGEFIMINSLVFVLIMELRDNYLHQGHHNRMVLLKDKIKSIVDCARTLLIERCVAQIC